MSGKKCLYYKSYFFLRWQRERSNTCKICSILRHVYSSRKLFI